MKQKKFVGKPISLSRNIHSIPEGGNSKQEMKLAITKKFENN
jgi:hypothetical protein